MIRPRLTLGSRASTECRGGTQVRAPLSTKAPLDFRRNLSQHQRPAKSVPMTRKITLKINGKSYSHEVEPRLLLIHYLRDVVGFTGPHIGCETSICGACTVELDGKAVKSCTMFAVQADGRNVTTIEGLATDGRLHPMQEAFWN